jgi:hypothetical protein
MSYAKNSRARAESIIQMTVAGQDDATAFVLLDRRRVGAGLRMRMR